MKYRTDKHKNLVKTHSSSYRKKVRVYEDKIREVYRERRSLELGEYRHGDHLTNYDTIVSKAIEKWEPRDERVALEIVHSIQNRVNSMILRVILEEHAEIIKEGLI